MISIMHDSHDEFYRNPFGALKCKAQVTLRLDVLADASVKDKVFNVKLFIREDGNPLKAVDMECESQTESTSTYVANIKMPCDPYITWYFFSVSTYSGTIYYGNNEKSLGGRGKIYYQNPTPFQITVYSSDYNTPSWYRESVVYQIFVDRFFNGNSNGQILNPKPQSLIHANWNDTPFYTKDSRGDVIKWDFYGGNIKGIIKKLDYLKELGISCIYLNPVFESASNHKYDVGDYKKIDSMFGDEKEIEDLCTMAAEKGIRIMLDGVFSHTGSDSVYFNKYSSYDGIGAYQSKDSKYYKWYKFGKHPDEYKSWWGIKALPEVNELEESYMDFIIRDEDSVISHWMKRGIKGWRLDVADELPDEFIEQIRKRVKGIDKEAVIIGEVWEDASNKVSYEKRRNYFSGSELDGVTNYPFRNIISEYILGSISSKEASERFISIYENYPEPAFYSNLNLIGSHDVSRILTLLGEAPDEKKLKDFERYSYRLPKNARKLAIKRLKLMSLVQMTFPGVPCIYYGDEAGLEGYSDPFNRDSFPWGREEKEILEWYKMAIGLRNSNGALKSGKWKSLQSHDDIFSFARTLRAKNYDGKSNEADVVLVAVNRSEHENITWNADVRDAQCMQDCLFVDLLTGKRHESNLGMIEIVIGKLGAVVLKKVD